jgi:hypothetical protein
MSFKPKPPRPMPEELAILGPKLLRFDSPYRLVGEQLYEQFDKADYVDLYHPEGKPAISPILLPREQLGDAGYISGPNLAQSQQRGIDLIGPAPSVQSPPSRLPDGLTQDQFCVDWETNTARCPGGQTSNHGIRHSHGGTQFRFKTVACKARPLHSRCCTGKRGRSININPYLCVLQEAQAFKAIYRKHRGGVQGCLSALVRAHGIRRKRYIGQAKGHLQALFTGVAANLRRASSWSAGKRQVRHKGLGLATITYTAA